MSFLRPFRRQIIFCIFGIILVLLTIYVPWQLKHTLNALIYWHIASDVAHIILIALWAAFARSLYPLLTFLGLTISVQIAFVIFQLVDKRSESGWRLSLIALLAFIVIAITVLLIVRSLSASRRKIHHQQLFLQATVDALPLKVGVHRRDGFTQLSNEGSLSSEMASDSALYNIQNESFVQFLWQNINRKGDVAELRGKLFEHKFSTFNEQTLYQIGYGLLDIPRFNAYNAADDYLMVYALDVSERERMMLELLQVKDEAERANRAKTQFLANVSHELRTPLTAIVGFSQLMMMRDDVDDDLREMIDTITRNGESLLHLVNDVLDLSKAETGNLSLHNVIFEPESLLNDEISIFRPQIEAKGLKLRVRVTSDVPTYLLGDATKIRQIVRNLLSNAWKFTERGGVEVRMWSSDFVIWHKQLRPQPSAFAPQILERLYAKSIEHMPEQSHHIVLHIEVVDSGQGIAAEELATIFEPFTQSRSGVVSEQGTGLGLAICKKFAHFLSGDLILTSQPNRGTSCHFFFTAERSEDD